MKELLLWATYYYYRFGFNITYISPEQNLLLGRKKPYKSSTNDRSLLGYQRQDYSDIVAFDWQKSRGIGTVTGFNNVRVLDFDKIGISDKKNSNDTVLRFIDKVLKMLNLPYNYEWVIRSGSDDGFHILLYSDEHSYPSLTGSIKGFFANSKYSSFLKD